MSPASYVRLKHALSAVALAAVADPAAGARSARALAAYARLGAGRSVPVADLAREAGITTCDLGRLLAETALFENVRDRPRLAPGYAPYAASLASQAVRIAEAVRLLGRPAPAAAPEAVRRGVALFNAGLFFACHEYLEGAWRGARGPDRAFYRGLIQAAAACYHCEKGNRHGTAALARRAAEGLRAFAPARHGVDVAALLAGLEAVRAEAGRGALPPPGGRPALPRIAFRARAARRRTHPRRA